MIDHARSNTVVQLGLSLLLFPLLPGLIVSLREMQLIESDVLLCVMAVSSGSTGRAHEGRRTDNLPGATMSFSLLVRKESIPSLSAPSLLLYAGTSL